MESPEACTNATRFEPPKSRIIRMNLARCITFVKPYIVNVMKLRKDGAGIGTAGPEASHSGIQDKVHGFVRYPFHSFEAQDIVHQPAE